MGLEMFWYVVWVSVTLQEKLKPKYIVTTDVQLNFKESFGWFSHHLQMEQSNCSNTTIFQLGWHSS